jgi:uncharacterized membrane protein
MRVRRWTKASGSVFVTELELHAVSDDCSILVGDTITDSGAQHAARWANGARVELAFPRVTDTASTAIGTSEDGSVVFGNAWSSSPLYTTEQAFRWTGAGGAEGLGFLPGDTTSEAWAMSRDGAIVVGLSYNPEQRTVRPFRWTSADGMVELHHPASTLTVPFAVGTRSPSRNARAALRARP